MMMWFASQSPVTQFGGDLLQCSHNWKVDARQSELWECPYTKDTITYRVEWIDIIEGSGNWKKAAELNVNPWWCDLFPSRLSLTGGDLLCTMQSNWQSWRREFWVVWVDQRTVLKFNAINKMQCRVQWEWQGLGRVYWVDLSACDAMVVQNTSVKSVKCTAVPMEWQGLGSWAVGGFAVDIARSLVPVTMCQQSSSSLSSLTSTSS